MLLYVDSTSSVKFHPDLFEKKTEHLESIFAVRFSRWQYMAELDLPCIIDKVLSETKQSKFYLIGHSMGTTIAFSLLSSDHSYDGKVRQMYSVYRNGHELLMIGFVADLLHRIT